MLTLCDPDKHHTVRAMEIGAMRIGNIILALPSFELHHRDTPARHELVDRFDESVMKRTKQRRRWDGVSEVLAEKIAKLSRGLQSREIAIDVEPVNTGVGQRDVLFEKLSNVGHHGNPPREVSHHDVDLSEWSVGHAGSSGPASTPHPFRTSDWQMALSCRFEVSVLT
jgi:hypothetical protein